MVKVKPVQLGKTERMSFSRIDEVIDMPNLDRGAEELIPVVSQRGPERGLPGHFDDRRLHRQPGARLYRLPAGFEPKYSIKECKERDVTLRACFA